MYLGKGLGQGVVGCREDDKSLTLYKLTAINWCGAAHGSWLIITGFRLFQL